MPKIINNGPQCPTVRQFFEGKCAETTYSVARQKAATLTPIRFNRVLGCADIEQAQADLVKFDALVELADDARSFTFIIACHFGDNLRDCKDDYRLRMAPAVANELRELADAMLACADLFGVAVQTTRNLSRDAGKMHDAVRRIEAGLASGTAARDVRNAPENLFAAASKAAVNAAFHVGQGDGVAAVEALGGRCGYNFGDQTLERSLRELEQELTGASELADKHGYDISALLAKTEDMSRAGFASKVRDALRIAKDDFSSSGGPAHERAAAVLIGARMSLLAAEHSVVGWDDAAPTPEQQAANVKAAMASLEKAELRAHYLTAAYENTGKANNLTLLATLAEAEGGPAEWINGLRFRAACHIAVADTCKETVAAIDDGFLEKSFAQLDAEAARVA